MFTREELKKNLIGCFEIALFMPAGVDRYSPSKSAALRSFLVPALFIPLVAWVWILRSDAEPASLIVAVHLTRMVLTMAIFLGVVYLFARQYERHEHFFRFVTASNWHEVIGVILVLPVLFALLMGADIGPWENYAVFIQLFGYVYVGFIATHVLRIPWELGGFLAVVSLAVGQQLLDWGLDVQSIVTVAV